MDHRSTRKTVAAKCFCFELLRRNTLWHSGCFGRAATERRFARFNLFTFSRPLVTSPSPARASAVGPRMGSCAFASAYQTLRWPTSADPARATYRWHFAVAARLRHALVPSGRSACKGAGVGRRVELGAHGRWLGTPRIVESRNAGRRTGASANSGDRADAGVCAGTGRF